MAALLIGYARCSTDQQDITAQHDGLIALGVSPTRIYVDHGLTGTTRDRPGCGRRWRPAEGTVNLSNPRAIFAGSPPRLTRSRVTYEAYVVSRTSTQPQVDAMKGRGLRSS